MDFLIIVNDAPYATERPYNALRLATSLAEDSEANVRLFFIGDGVCCAAAVPKPPESAHDIEWMLRRFLAGGREAGVCRTCMEARGIAEESLIEGARRATLADLTEWTRAARQTLVF